jgi:hypothetical protein
MSAELYEELLKDDYPFELEHEVSKRINALRYFELENQSQLYYKLYLDFDRLAYEMEHSDDGFNVFVNSHLLVKVYELLDACSAIKGKYSVRWVSSFVAALMKTVHLKRDRRVKGLRWDEDMYVVMYTDNVTDDFPIVLLAEFVIEHPNDFKSLFYHEQ